MEVVCKSCGTVNDYRTEQRGNNLAAWCNSCGRYIKNITWQEPTFYVGKHKGTKMKDCWDIGYLEWYLANVKISQDTREYLEKRIPELKEHKILLDLEP